MQYFLFYIAIINSIGFILMGADKKKAIRGAWRIPEVSFFYVALLGGALGCILGMRYFRHKTKHWYFQYGMPLILLAECLLFFWLCQLLY